MIRRPPRSTLSSSSAASDVYKRQIKDGDIYILEVNPRASRTVPFVAKTVGTPFAKIGALVMAGAPLASFHLKKSELKHVGVKEAVFPFARFPGVDTLLGPEMR